MDSAYNFAQRPKELKLKGKTRRLTSSCQTYCNELHFQSPMDPMGIILFNPEINWYCTQWRHTDSTSLELCAVSSEEKIIAVSGVLIVPSQPTYCIPGSGMVVGHSYQMAMKVPCSFISHDSTLEPHHRATTVQNQLTFTTGLNTSKESSQ
jgi:hypothetical protein